VPDGGTGPGDTDPDPFRVGRVPVRVEAIAPPVEHRPGTVPFQFGWY